MESRNVQDKKNGEQEKEKSVKDASAKEYSSGSLKEIIGHPGVKILLGTTAAIALLYASRYLLNGTAETIRAYKNVRRALKEG